jgi:hypothetical protein
MRSGVMEGRGNLQLSEIAWPRAITIGQDTEIMSRYTLPTGTATETITFSVPHPEDQGTPDNQTLTVHMGFLGDTTHQLSMRGYGDDSNFADGLEIVDTAGTLTALTLELGPRWPDGWTITVDPNPALNEEGQKQDFTIQPESKDWEVSVKISNGRITTGDPKIKVIRPTS